MGGQTTLKGVVVYFNVTEALPHRPRLRNRQQWGQQLITDLLKASRKYGGCLLTSNGGHMKRTGKQRRRLKCNHGRKHQRPSKKKQQDNPARTHTVPSVASYRETSHTQDKRNARGTGVVETVFVEGAKS
jgi:hypothetical protein